MPRLRKPTAIRLLALALASLAACSHDAAKQPDANIGATDDWPGVGGGADEAQYSKLTEIDTASVDRLGLAWALDLPGEVTLEATPLEVAGTIFFTGSYAKAYAVDALTGKVKWTFDPKTWQHDPAAMHFSFGANRGMAYENGRVFFASLDGRLFGLDAKTGKQLWVTETVPEGAYNISTGAPRVMNGKVIIGNGGADFGARGYVTAVDAATGKEAWKFFTTPGKPGDNNNQPELERAAATWGPAHLKAGGGGGTVWNGMTFDPARNRVYIGVGNAGPYDPEARDPGGGDNLYTSSIVALDAGTGKYLWHYQENPRDSWDYKATPNIVTATLNLDGRARDVILHAPTNGFLYVIDRDTGKVISAGASAQMNWARGIDLKTGRPIENRDIRYETGLTKIWPGTVGGHNWQPMSYSPRTGLVYIPQQQIGARFSRKGGSENAFNVMGLTLEPIVEKPGDGHGFLVAWDPVAQKQAWRVEHKGLWNGGTLATAGNLVFQGTADGYFKAFDAANGKEVWSFNAGLGIIGAPISYRLNGKQYVSILVGYGGTTAAYGKFMDMGWKYGAQPRRLLTFALDGKAALPASPAATFKVAALDDPALTLNEADVAAGRGLSIQCAACHGVGLQSTGTPGPDLRESGIALKLDTFKELLKSGALMEQGMPRFENLTDEQIRQLHAYVRAKAREALGKRQADRSAPMPKL
ncbi:quinohemoprotein ethanol dehydrogenase [Novosphingobium chloroacetimidivorans]|uniref:Quinohemoprotein ethanol dehydrogenase n=1 Tax=Novosphingobium chloroacetimidivorans TaxID=1428314 RepID=A0A7W7K5L7_9SPHN|nr:PQQ-dependent dehydrogenase, methanol/ethanol family [Novosphingobium chloroacetimidivorans]MBB4856705.1 quinohemoprotein ethanol dehydrogenase [Novosphingobium chloroacetimidivorans]